MENLTEYLVQSRTIWFYVFFGHFLIFSVICFIYLFGPLDSVYWTSSQFFYHLSTLHFRPSDGRMSNTSFIFRYHRHFSPEDPFDSDSDEDQDMDNPDDPEEKNKLIRFKNPEFRTNGKNLETFSGLTVINIFWQNLSAVAAAIYNMVIYKLRKAQIG